MCRQLVAMAEGAMVAGAPSAEEGGYRAALAVALTLLGQCRAWLAPGNAVLKSVHRY